MKDYFGKEVKIGDRVLYIPRENKYFAESNVIGFTKLFGKPAIELASGKNLQSEFIILNNL